jgi:hypothetical protein
MTWKRALHIAAASAFWLAVGGTWVWWEFIREPKRRPVAHAAQPATGAYTVATYPTAGGSIQVVNVVSPDPNFDGMLERRRCFVWRDAISGTSSMSCDGAGFPN